MKVGYEASLLVLEGYPLENFGHVKDIKARFKQGYFISLDSKWAAEAQTGHPDKNIYLCGSMNKLNGESTILLP